MRMSQNKIHILKLLSLIHTSTEEVNKICHELKAKKVRQLQTL